MIYAFDQFKLDSASFALTADGEAVAVEPQVFNVLVFLVENRDRIVSKDELIDAVWDGRAISDGALNSRINSVRRVVGDDGKRQAVIKTFPRRGFRFVAELADAEHAGDDAGAALASGKPSLAVMPFENLSGDAEQDYFSDGITEDIITALSRVSQFFVIARNTTFAYRGQAVDVQTVAKELGVRYVLEGSVRKAGNRVRISAQLIAGDTGNHIWADKYDRDLEDVFAVQDEITGTVVAAIGPELSRAEQARAAGKPTENLDAWDLYQRGMQSFYRRTKKDNDIALEYFSRAQEMEPGFCLAFVGAAKAHFFYGRLDIFGLSEHHAHHASAFENARKAIELDPTEPLARVALGEIHMQAGEHDLAAQQIEIAIQQNPNDAAAYFRMGHVLSWSGKPSEALEYLNTAMSLSPLDPEMGPQMVRKAECYLFLGEFEDAVHWGQKSVAEPTTGNLGFYALMSALGHLGRALEAERVHDAMNARFPKQDGWAFIKRFANRALTNGASRALYLEGLRLAKYPGSK